MSSGVSIRVIDIPPDPIQAPQEWGATASSCEAEGRIRGACATDQFTLRMRPFVVVVVGWALPEGESVAVDVDAAPAHSNVGGETLGVVVSGIVDVRVGNVVEGWLSDHLVGDVG